jgi:hypothetical protein
MLFASRLARNVRCCSAVLAAACMLTPFVHAQSAVDSLQITIIDGEDAINNIRQRTTREPIVQVEDQNHRPVAGAAVLFLLPNDGASGTFAGGARTLTTVTDSNGRAVARGFRPNHISGKYQIRVQASYQGKTTQTTINQSNIAGSGGGGASSAGFPKWLAVVAAGAVAATVTIVATRSGSSTPSASSVPVAVTPAGGSVGAPH